MVGGNQNRRAEQMAKKAKTKAFGNSIKFSFKGELTLDELHDRLNDALEKLDPGQSYKFGTLFVTPADQSTIKNPRIIQITGPHRTAADDFNL